MTRSRRNRRARRIASPHIYVGEETALTAADTVSNEAIYTNTFLASETSLPMRVVWKDLRVTVTYGSATTRVFAILRRLPQGYTAPAITIATGNVAFVDQPDVLGYGMIQVSGNDTMNRIDLRKLKGSVILHSGDALLLQVVSDTASANQKYSVISEYSLGT